MIEFISGFGLAIVSIYFIGKIKMEKGEKEVKIIDKSGGSGWSLYVEPTTDMNIYRGIYHAPTGRKYTYEGNGISNTLEGLAKEVEKP